MEYYGRYKTYGTAVRIIETGEIFDTRTQCAEHLGVSVGMISMCISGKVKSCKGFHIELINAIIEHRLDNALINALYDMTGVNCNWREHPTRTNVYVSDTGIIARKYRGRLTVQKQHIINSGYLTVSLSDKVLNDFYGRMSLVHRLVAETYIDNPYEKPEVNHKNGNKFDNNVLNLEWCTKSENMRHAYGNDLCHTELVRVVETGLVYKSSIECARAIGGTVSGIHDCKSGRQTQHRGYHFEFPEGAEVYYYD